ncbi:hypothetical protein J4573_18095 [Actinomadura barringtoniae]|uniref:Uncharacterized protein n=1 Tax=Actinomadura barringtoniae TaxID=1427535 RepID=A0A939TAF5_9ACTN|nr:hypothetical protein [Actinomadura barringtoniae]MBO2449020.1 hypothetical protein [Actinomadura barringtoniae]
MDDDRVDLFKPVAPPPDPPPAGPGWIVVPARAIALVVVLPFRLVHDLFMLIGRGIRGLMRTVGQALYAWLLRPVGRLFAAIGHGIAAAFDFLLVRPLRWLVVVVILGFLRLFGRGTGRLGRWFYRMLLAPIGRFFAWIGRGMATGFTRLWRGLLWLLNVLIVLPLTLVGRGLAWLFRGIATAAGAVAMAIAWVFATVVVLPLALLWRHILRPPLQGLWWLLRKIGSGLAYIGHGIAAIGRAIGAGLAAVARVIGAGLAYIGRGIAAVFRAIGSGIAAVWRVIAAAFAWAWRTASMILRRLGRVLIVIPALAIYRYVLRPIGLGVTWVWRTFVVLPARWIGSVVRTVWHVTVRAPLRWINQSLVLPVRVAARDIRLQLRRAFRG